MINSTPDTEQAREYGIRNTKYGVWSMEYGIGNRD